MVLCYGKKRGACYFRGVGARKELAKGAFHEGYTGKSSRGGGWRKREVPVKEGFLPRRESVSIDGNISPDG